MITKTVEQSSDKSEIVSISYRFLGILIYRATMPYFLLRQGIKP